VDKPAFSGSPNKNKKNSRKLQNRTFKSPNSMGILPVKELASVVRNVVKHTPFNQNVIGKASEKVEAHQRRSSQKKKTQHT